MSFSKKIYILMANFKMGGSEKVMVNLASELARTGQDIEIIVVNGFGPLRSELSGVRVTDLKGSGIFASLPKLLVAVRSPAVLVSTLTYVNIFNVLIRVLKGFRIVSVIREGTTVSQNLGIGKSALRSAVTKILVRVFYPLANGVIGVSRGVCHDLTDQFHIPQEKISMIGNPTLPRNIGELAGCGVKEAWFEDSSLKVIVALGRLHTAKNYPYLIKSFGLAREEDPNLRLVIVGEGDKRGSLEALLKELNLSDFVHLVGAAANPYPYLQKADLFVLSSDWEGMPNALIQAMALGCPVVATDCPSGPRDLLSGLKSGVLVAPGDEQALKAAMLKESRLTQDAKELMGRVEEFKVERVAQSFMNYLNSLEAANS